jgi:hypothetical protein
MRKGFLIGVGLVGLLAIPAIAFAVKFNTNVSAHVNDDEDQIFGVVRSSDFACEKRRDVRLYGPDHSIINGNGSAKGNGDSFRRIDEQPTNRFGEYRFGGDNGIFLKGRGFPPGEYFVRALRKDFPGAVCRRDDSPHVFIEHDIVTEGGE